MRIPPHSVEAEQSVLGSILLDKEAMISVSETLVPEDFYKEAHKVIYESMLKLYNSQSEIDLISVIIRVFMCIIEFHNNFTWGKDRYKNNKRRTSPKKFLVEIY